MRDTVSADRADAAIRGAANPGAVIPSAANPGAAIPAAAIHGAAPVWGPLCLLLTATLLAFGTTNRVALFGPAQFFLVLSAAMVGVVYLAISGWSRLYPQRPQRHGQTILTAAAAGVTILFAAAALYNAPPIGGIKAFTDLKPFSLFAALTAVLVGMMSFSNVRAGRYVLAAASVVFAITCIWSIHLLKVVTIDVWVVHEWSCNALLHGNNPFAITYPDVYGPHTPFMDPAAIKNGMVQAGYPYPPLTLLMALPGYILGKDIRYACGAAVIGAALLTGWLMGRRDETSWPAKFSQIIAIGLLAMPETFFIVQMSWTEVYIALLLAAFVFAAVRYPVAAPWIFGLFLVSKQHLPFVAPLALLLFPKPLRVMDVIWFIAKAAAAGAVVTLPFVLWDVKAFDHSVLGIFHATAETTMLPRTDSLTLFAALNYYGLPALTPVLVYLAPLGVMTAALVVFWRSRTRLADTLAAIGLTLLTLFLFAHHAFANHYYLIFVCFLLAAAAHVIETAGPGEAADRNGLRAA